MTRLTVLLGTILSLLCFPIASPAADRPHFDLNTGIGFAVDSSANTTFSFGAGANYHFTKHVAAGPFFDLFPASGLTTLLSDEDAGAAGVRTVSVTSTRYKKATLGTGGQLVLSAWAANDLEFLVSAGAGYLRVMDVRGGLTFPVGFGAYLSSQEGATERIGIGTYMSLQFTTLDGTHVIWNWRVLSLEYQF
jgi:hypothetical protein